MKALMFQHLTTLQRTLNNKSKLGLFDITSKFAEDLDNKENEWHADDLLHVVISKIGVDMHSGVIGPCPHLFHIVSLVFMMFRKLCRLYCEIIFKNYPVTFKAWLFLLLFTHPSSWLLVELNVFNLIGHLQWNSSEKSVYMHIYFLFTTYN